MSRLLRDSAERHVNKTLQLLQKGKQMEALTELEKAEEAIKFLLDDPENEFFQKNLKMKFTNFISLGNFLYNLGRFPQAQNSTNCLC